MGERILLELLGYGPDLLRREARALDLLQRRDQDLDELQPVVRRDLQPEVLLLIVRQKALVGAVHGAAGVCAACWLGCVG